MERKPILQFGFFRSTCRICNPIVAKLPSARLSGFVKLDSKKHIPMEIEILSTRSQVRTAAGRAEPTYYENSLAHLIYLQEKFSLHLNIKAALAGAASLSSPDNEPPLTWVRRLRTDG